MWTVFSTGEEGPNKTNMLDTGRQCSAWEKWLVAEGLLEGEECLGFVLNSALRLAFPKICLLAFLTPVT